MMRHLFSILAVVLCFSASKAQPTVGVQHLYPERLHEDIEVLREIVHTAHPDPYRYKTKLELDQLIDSISGSIQVPLNEVEFTNRIRPIFKAIGDSHCYSDWASDFSDRMTKHALLIPVQVKLLADGLYLESELKGFRSIPPGSKILSINGRSAGSIVEQLIATVICDGANRTYAERTVERDFPERYHAYVEMGTTFNVEFITADGERGVQEIFGLTRKEIDQSRKPDGALLPWAANWIPEQNTMWVTMRSLDVDELAAAGQKHERFLDALLSELQKKKVDVVVLDVRGSGGRELLIAEEVFSAFAREPFKLLTDMYGRTATPKEMIADKAMPVDYLASAEGSVSKGPLGLYRLPTNDPRLVEHEPMAKAYGGKMYVVADGHTRDASAALVMLMRRNHRARVIGEELGSNSYSFTGGEELLVRAPNSGVLFHVPLLMYVPAGRGDGPNDRGEQPDHQAHQTPVFLSRGQDSVKASLLQMIDFFR